MDRKAKIKTPVLNFREIENTNQNNSIVISYFSINYLKGKKIMF